MPSISIFQMADTNAGAIQTVIVEIKYISSTMLPSTQKTRNFIRLHPKRIRESHTSKNPKTGVVPAPFSFVYLFLNFCFVCFVACCVLFLFVCFCFVLSFIFFGFRFLLFPLKSFSYTESKVYFVLFFLLRFFPVFCFYFINTVVLRFCLVFGLAVYFFQSLLASSPLYENNKRLNKTRFLSQDPKFI